ncbi:MAG TPA: hypothetical protein VHC69_05210 [Polyangiaceae bacterium]|nr:hypothetical protein [Polyangiaceae bacterium]
MLRRDGSAKRAAALGVVFLLACLAPWPRLGSLYASACCAVFNALTDGVTFGADAVVQFAPGAEALLAGKPYPLWHAIAAVSSVSTQATTHFGLNLRAVGYVPTVTFVALVLAWPLHRRRSWVAAAVGFALVQVYFGFSIALPMLLALSSERVGAVALDSSTQSFVRMIFEAFVVPPAMSYAIPGVLYAFVAFIGSGGAPYVKAHESRSLLSGFRKGRALSTADRGALPVK